MLKIKTQKSNKNQMGRIINRPDQAKERIRNRIHGQRSTIINQTKKSTSMITIFKKPGK